MMKRGNMLEFLFQSPFWLFFYATGLVLPLEVGAWFVYSLGWHVHPKFYPLPHTAFMDLLAESIRYLRFESRLAQRFPKAAKRISLILAVVGFVGVTLLFFWYLKYLYLLWLTDEPVLAFFFDSINRLFTTGELPTIQELLLITTPKG